MFSTPVVPFEFPGGAIRSLKLTSISVARLPTMVLLETWSL